MAVEENEENHMARYLYSELASALDARKRCESKPESEWFGKWTDTIEDLVKQHMPHGSGFDSGTTLDLDASHADKLVFQTSFHHMDEWGGYDGWTEHTITVTPSLQMKYHIRISGRNRNDIKDMIHESFDVALSTDVRYDLWIERFPEFAITSKWENPDGTPSQSSIVWYASDGTKFTSVDRNATNTYDSSPYERARAYAANQMERKAYGR